MSIAAFPLPVARAARAGRILYGVGLAALLIAWLLPLAAVALTSVRPLDEILAGALWGWPRRLVIDETYGAILADGRMLRFMANSFLIALPAVAGAVTLATMAGFALARYRFPGNTLLLILFVAGNLVPFQVLMIPVRDLMAMLDLYDTRVALILFHIAFQTGFGTMFMRNFIRQLPEPLFDAARVEGLSELQIFRLIALPLVRPAMAAIAALIFTFVWNDFFWALVLVQSDEVRPLTAGLQSLRGMWLTSWNVVAAGSLIAAAPPIVAFFLMQRQFIAGLTAGVPAE